MIKIILFLFILNAVVSESKINDLTPLQLTSLQLTREDIPEYQNVPFLFMKSINLKLKKDQLLNTQVIGSISQINTFKDPVLSIEFTYKLDTQNQSIDVAFTIRSKEAISQTFKMVLDFMVAQLPQDYSVQIFNMTQYQEHIMYDTTKYYQLVVFINGFSNISLSANITHAYNHVGQMYTVHYMGCLDEDAERGWKKGIDYVLFTAVILPRQRKIQKFHLYQTYSVDYDSGYNYFYGIKGIQSPQFEGTFQTRLNGVIFHMNQNKGRKSYGLGLIYVPTSANYIEERVHEKASTKYAFVIIIVIALILLGAALFWKIRNKQKRAFLVEESGRLQNNSIVSEGISVVKQTNTKTDIPTPIDTIVEVSQSLEYSHPGAKSPTKKSNEKQ